MPTYPRAKGKNTALLLKSENVNRLQDTAEQVANLKVEVQQTDTAGNVLSRQSAIIKRSPHGMIITIPAILASGSGGGNQIFGGNGPPSASTLPVGSFVSGLNPSCYVDETNDNFYFCSTAGTQATAVWTQISGASNSAQVRGFVIAPTNGSNFASKDTFFNANPWPGGTITQVNKSPELWGSNTQEIIYGDIVNYSNYSADFNSRTATDSFGNSEFQYVIPAYAPGQMIYAINSNGLNQNKNSHGTPDTGAIIASSGWLEILPARHWGAVNT